MTQLFKADTRLEVWAMATDHLLKVGRDLNVILDIGLPQSEGANAEASRKLVDAFLVSEDQYPLHTVAETIFPGWEYMHRGLKGVFEKYAKEEYAIIKKGGMNPWGTYAQRILQRKNEKGEIINPLKNLIEKMKDEKGKPGPKRSCYEIGVAEGEYDLPLYNTVNDLTRRLGGPCLSHLSFKLYDAKVHLTAIYRSHDYRHKVLGNLLGLTRLQICVAKETGLEVGTLVVHSTYANIGAGGKEALKKLVDDLRSMSGVAV